MAHYIIQVHEILIHTAHMNIVERIKIDSPGLHHRSKQEVPLGIPFVQMCNILRFFATFYFEHFL